MKTILPLLATLLSLGSTDAFSQPSNGLVANTARRGRTASHLFSTAPARAVAEGISKTTTVEGFGRQVRAGNVVLVKYFCTAAGSDVTFSRSNRQRIVACDGSMIRGWDAAIRTMKEGERASVVISDPQYAYGAAGVPPFVPPNAEIRIDMEVISVEENAGLAASGSDVAGLDGMLDGPANRPRTPGAIAAAYEQRLKEKAIDAPEEREGIFGFYDWIKGSYFFGLFEGETGQEAPWYLKPSITFPIAFVVVGFAFAVSLLGGAISERGAPSTDELDEIIISSEFIRSTITMALSMNQM